METDDPTPHADRNLTPPAPTDGRVRRSQAAVLSATTALLNERGLGGVSVDEIARRSGVAKTTIYRHWPTRADLLVDACTRLSTPMATPDTGHFGTDLTAALTELTHLLDTARWSRTLPSVVDAAERDPELARVLGRIQHGHMTPFLHVIARAARRGEITPPADPSTVVAALLGPLYYRRWFTREPLDAAFVASVVRNVVVMTAPGREPPA